MILTRYLLDLVVTEMVKTWTQGIVRAQWNEPNRCVTECVLWSQKNPSVTLQKKKKLDYKPSSRVVIDHEHEPDVTPTWSGLRSKPVMTSCKVPSPPATISMSVCSMSSISFFAWPS